jgi:hypothetical protein
MHRGIVCKDAVRQRQIAVAKEDGSALQHGAKKRVDTNQRANRVGGWSVKRQRTYCDVGGTRMACM